MTELAEYIKVAKQLKDAIIREEFKEGDLLPSENELSEKFGLTRTTIRNALKNLEIEGLIYKHKGKGSIVKSKRKSFEILALRGFTEVMKRKGENLKIDTKFINPISLANWPSDFHWSLSEQEVNAGCIKMVRTRILEEKPVMLERTFLPNLYLDNFLKTPLVNGSLFDTLIVNHSIEMVRVEQKVRAIIADEPLLKALNLDIGDPVLEIIRKLHTNREHFHIYSYSYCNTKEFSIDL